MRKTGASRRAHKENWGQLIQSLKKLNKFFFLRGVSAVLEGCLYNRNVNKCCILCCIFWGYLWGDTASGCVAKKIESFVKRGRGELGGVEPLLFSGRRSRCYIRQEIYKPSSDWKTLLKDSAQWGFPGTVYTLGYFLLFGVFRVFPLFWGW